MMRQVPCLISLGAALLLTPGCGGRSIRIPDLPNPGHEATGTLEITVLGSTGPLEYFLDGAKLVGASSHGADSRVEWALPPGTYRIEGRYRIGRFELRALRSHIRTRHPVRVDANRTTRLRADVRRLPSDVPEETVHYFRVDEPRDEERMALESPSTGDVPIETPWPSVDRSRALADPLERYEADLVPAPDGGRVVPEQISIRGTEVVIGGRRWGTGRPRPTPPADDTAVGSAPRPEVTLLVQSVPPGAHASLGEQYLGRTPLRVRVDPTRDHVFYFEREGCTEQVQLVDVASWKNGRAPAVSVRLDCR